MRSLASRSAFTVVWPVEEVVHGIRLLSPSNVWRVLMSVLDTSPEPPTPASTLPADCPIFVVDDDAKVLRVLARALEECGYPVTAFDRPQDVLDALPHEGLTLLVSDRDMPGMDGIELARRVMEEDPDLAVIMLTGVPTVASAADSLRLGLVDYLTKPMDMAALETAVAKALSKRSRSILQRESEAWLRSAVEERTSELREAQLELERLTVGVLAAISSVVDSRNSYFRDHSERVADVSVGIARALALSPTLVEEIRVGALLHDIGMIAVPDSVLGKEGALDQFEWAHVHAHPTVGAQILKPLYLLGPSVACVMSHHERLDGSGYPEGLIGDAIPLAAQIVGAADTWCALTHDRSFGGPRTVEEGLEVISRLRGVQFREDVIDALLAFIES